MRFNFQDIITIIVALAILIVTTGLAASTFYSSYLREQRFQRCMEFNNKVIEEIKDKLQKHESPLRYTMVC